MSDSITERKINEYIFKCFEKYQYKISIDGEVTKFFINVLTDKLVYTMFGEKIELTQIYQKIVFLSKIIDFKDQSALRFYNIESYNSHLNMEEYNILPESVQRIDIPYYKILQDQSILEKELEKTFLTYENYFKEQNRFYLKKKIENLKKWKKVGI